MGKTGAAPQKITILATIILIFLSLAIFIAAFLITRGNTDLFWSRVIQREVAYVETIGQDIQHTIDQLQSDLDFIVSVSGLEDFEQIASDFANANGRYDQIRILDSDGMEINRINFDTAGAEIVPESELQNKSQRYYFQNTMALPLGQVFFSPIDLNFERGEIEVPYKPMLRIAKSFLDKKQQKQIVVLNFLAEKLISRLDRESPRLRHGQLMLLNQEGYFLFGHPEDLNWGFHFPETPGDWKFQDVFPQIPTDILDTGSFELRLENGVLVSETIFPMDDSQILSESYRWHLFSFLTQVEEQELPVLMEYLIWFAGILVLFLVTLTFLLLRNIHNKHRFSLKTLGQNQRIRSLLKEKKFLIKEIHHRVKNDFTLISSYLNLRILQGVGKVNEDILREVEEKIYSITSLYQIIYQGDDVTKVDLAKFIQNLSQQYQLSLGGDDSTWELDLEKVELDHGTAVSLAMILGELFTNSTKYAGESFKIQVQLRDDGSYFHLCIGDDGPGFPEGFPDKVKSQGSGFGLSMVQMLAKKIGAEVSFSNEDGAQTSLKIPKSE